jgi:epoxyqueuosine reductase QueG
MGLLMTPSLGPRVRIAVVTTDLPLVADPATDDPTVLDFCGICRKCADICPAQAIPAGPPADIDGVTRWRIDQEACFTYWCRSGTDCGQCIRVCPYAHPDTALHRLVRRGLRHSALFRRLALRLDDLIYDRRPAPKPGPDWLPRRENGATDPRG